MYQKTSCAPLFENFLKGKFSNKKEKQAFLHQSLSATASPQGEAYEIRLIHYYVFQGGVFGKRGTAQFFPVEAAFERFVAQLFRFEYHLRAVF